MSVESYKELDDFFRSMRQAYNNRDLKLLRSHYWTDNRFVHMDAAGRIDKGWGSFEEVLDQEFRYLDVMKLEFRDLGFQIFEDQFAAVSGLWRSTQVDPEGREVCQGGRANFSVVRMGDDWKIVSEHFSRGEDEE
ncbi:MAG: nuclear transport factor 2 family protein [Planctomycetota bacterium]